MQLQWIGSKLFFAQATRKTLKVVPLGHVDNDSEAITVFLTANINKKKFNFIRHLYNSKQYWSFLVSLKLLQMPNLS